MASEFASHVGMGGWCICRICEVYHQKTEEPVQEVQSEIVNCASEVREGVEAGAVDPEITRLVDFMTVCYHTRVSGLRYR